MSKIICISDLHFGHNRVQSADTANNIRDCLFPQLDDSVDILFITGDVFDGTISFNDVDSLVVLELFTELFLLCSEKNIKIRIVRGTFSHDHRQLELISKLYVKLDIQLDYKLFNEISIESIDGIGSVLYVPDNLPFPSKKEAFHHIHKLLQVIGIDRVDYVAMHGEFSHMIFGHVNLNAFDVTDFKDICSKYVFSGHIHKPLLYKNVISVGSFNRLAHNEEEAKGFWIIEENPRFVKNEGATLFKSFDFTRFNEIEDIIGKYDNLVSSFPEKKSFVRVFIHDVHLKQALLKYNDSKYLNIRLTFKNPSQKEKDTDTFLNDKLKKKETILLEVPSLENIASIVFNDIQMRGEYVDIKDIENILKCDILK